MGREELGVRGGGEEGLRVQTKPGQSHASY